MFKSWQFDTIDVFMSYKGMNQDISPEISPKELTYYLENILPTPLGYGTIRNGTKKIEVIKELHHDEVIQNIFSYTTKENVNQLILYVTKYIIDTIEGNIRVKKETNSIIFRTKNAGHYVKNTSIILRSNIESKNKKIKCNIKDVATSIISKGMSEIELFFDFSQILLPDIEFKEINYQRGCLYLYNFKQYIPLKLEGAESEILLAANSVARSVYFQGQLIICNGVDRVLQWNGEVLKQVISWRPYVSNKEDGRNFKIEDNIISFYMDFSDQYILPSDKVVLEKGRGLRMIIDGKSLYLTVEESAYNKETKTIKIKTKEDIPNIVNHKHSYIESEEEEKEKEEENIEVKLYYQDYPPRLSYIKVLNNRIFGFSEGAVGIEYRNSPFTVYFSYKPESLTDWMSDITKSMPYINMSAYQGKRDNLEAIEVLGSNILFIGRHNTQVWTGTNPLNAADFQYKTTLNGGVIHGDLVQPVGNDIWVVNSKGIQYFSTFNQARQLVANTVTGVNKIVQNYVQNVLVDDVSYRECSSFNYLEKDIIGFKIGKNNKTIIVSTQADNAFTLFSGSFSKTNDYKVFHNKLYLNQDNILIYYNDKNSNSENYNDCGLPINFAWSVPIINLQNKKFGCKFIEMQAFYSSDFIKNKKNSVFVKICNNTDENFTINNQYDFKSMGDTFEVIPLASFFSDINKDDGFNFSTDIKSSYQRLKFTSRSFWCIFFGSVVKGNFIMKNIKFHGRLEYQGTKDD